MASTVPSGVQIVGTTATPITLGATGGASDVWTWTHNHAMRALKVVALEATSRQEITQASVVITQPSVNSIVLTNTTAGPLTAVLEVTWKYDSTQLMAPLPSSVGVAS